MVATTIVVVTRRLAVNIARLVIPVTVVGRLHLVIIMTTNVILAAIVPRLLALLQSAIRIRLLGTRTLAILTHPRVVIMTPRIRPMGIRPVGQDPRTEAMESTRDLVRVIGDFSSFAFGLVGVLLLCIARRGA